MSQRSGLTQDEQAAIEEHARRLSAYVKLKQLVERWRQELALQEKADRIVARTCGGLVALVTIAAWGYLFLRFGAVLLEPVASPIYTARVSLWLLAAIIGLFPVFFVGFSYATWKFRPLLAQLVIYAIPSAIALFLVGLLVAPFIAWLVAS